MFKSLCEWTKFVSYNANDVTNLLEHNERFRAEIEKVKQHYKELFESIKITRTSTNAKTSSLLTQIEDLKAQLEGNLKVATRSSVKPKVLAPGMYAIDVKPIPHPLKNNRSAHLNYINHLKESVETVREIVKEAGRYSVNATPTVKIVLNKGKPIWKPKSKLSDNSLNKTKQIWQPKGKLSNNSLNKTKQVWKATGKKFALGELCPLTKLSVQCCSKHMTGNRSKLKNFVEKFIGSVRFGNDHFGAIMGYGDYVIGDSVISRVYYVEGLGHNLFSVGQFCDSDLEVAFRKHSCFVRDINGADLLKGSRRTNLYTISIDDMMKSSP
ncbi:hypothetical protein Tco_1408686 [Tanacetum coccineum]